jgi:hypothetical protein
MSGDEQLLKGRVYGAEHDDPNPRPAPEPDLCRTELVGGPLDGLLLDLHGWRTVEVDDGVALTTELSRWLGGRALYDPRTDEPAQSGPASSGKRRVWLAEATAPPRERHGEPGCASDFGQCVSQEGSRPAVSANGF